MRPALLSRGYTGHPQWPHLKISGNIQDPRTPFRKSWGVGVGFRGEGLGPRVRGFGIRSTLSCIMGSGSLAMKLDSIESAIFYR